MDTAGWAIRVSQKLCKSYFVDELTSDGKKILITPVYGTMLTGTLLRVVIYRKGAWRITT